MKKIIISILIIALVFSMFTITASAASYNDVSSSAWYYSPVIKWSEYGIFVGNNGSFMPNKSMTRAEWATVLQRVFSLSGQGRVSDMAGHWAASAARSVVGSGVMEAPSGMFNPDTPISRADACVSLAKAINILASVKNINVTFTDSGSMSSEESKYINAMATAGYVAGIGDGSFAPRKGLTRAEGCKMLDNVVEYLNVTDSKTTYSNESPDRLVILNTPTVVLRDVDSRDSIILGNKVRTAIVEDTTIRKSLICLGDTAVTFESSTIGDVLFYGEDIEIDMLDTEAPITVTGAVLVYLSGEFFDEVVIDSELLEELEIDADVEAIFVNEDVCDDYEADYIDITLKGTVDSLNVWNECKVLGSGNFKVGKFYDDVTLTRAPVTSAFISKGNTIKIGTVSFDAGASGRTYTAAELGAIKSDVYTITDNSGDLIASKINYNFNSNQDLVLPLKYTVGYNYSLAYGGANVSASNYSIEGTSIRIKYSYLKTLPMTTNTFVLYMASPVSKSQTFYVTNVSGATGTVLYFDKTYGTANYTAIELKSWSSKPTVYIDGVINNAWTWNSVNGSVTLPIALLSNLTVGTHTVNVQLGTSATSYTLNVANSSNNNAIRFDLNTNSSEYSNIVLKNVTSLYYLNGQYCITIDGSAMSAGDYYYNSASGTVTVYKEALSRYAAGTHTIRAGVSGQLYYQVNIVDTRSVSYNATYDHNPASGNYKTISFYGTSTANAVYINNSLQLSSHWSLNTASGMVTLLNVPNMTVGVYTVRIDGSGGTSNTYTLNIVDTRTSGSASGTYDLNPVGVNHASVQYSCSTGVTAVYIGGNFISSGNWYYNSTTGRLIIQNVLDNYQVGSYTVRVEFGANVQNFTLVVIDTRVGGVSFNYDLNPVGTSRSVVVNGVAGVTAVKINGTLVANGYYTYSSYASTLTLSTAYLDTLPVGVHSFVVEYLTSTNNYTITVADTRTGSQGTLSFSRNTSSLYYKNVSWYAVSGETLPFVYINDNAISTLYYTATPQSNGTNLIVIDKLLLASYSAGTYIVKVSNSGTFSYYTLIITNT